MTAPTTRTRRSTPRKQPSRTFTEWLPYFHNELGARDSRPATHRMYRQRLTQVVLFFGDVPPESLTVEHVEAWKDDMCERGLMPSTVNSYLPALGAFLNRLIAEGALTESPVNEGPLRADRHVPASREAARPTGGLSGPGPPRTPWSLPGKTAIPREP
jgi:site-specific recombinase XerC